MHYTVNSYEAKNVNTLSKPGSAFALRNVFS